MENDEQQARQKRDYRGLVTLRHAIAPLVGFFASFRLTSLLRSACLSIEHFDRSRKEPLRNNKYFPPRQVYRDAHEGVTVVTPGVLSRHCRRSRVDNMVFA